MFECVFSRKIIRRITCGCLVSWSVICRLKKKTLTSLKSVSESKESMKDWWLITSQSQSLDSVLIRHNTYQTNNRLFCISSHVPVLTYKMNPAPTRFSNVDADCSSATNTNETTSTRPNPTPQTIVNNNQVIESTSAGSVFKTNFYWVQSKQLAFSNPSLSSLSQSLTCTASGWDGCFRVSPNSIRQINFFFCFHNSSHELFLRNFTKIISSMFLAVHIVRTMTIFYKRFTFF